MEIKFLIESQRALLDCLESTLATVPGEARPRKSASYPVNPTQDLPENRFLTDFEEKKLEKQFGFDRDPEIEKSIEDQFEALRGSLPDVDLDFSNNVVTPLDAARARVDKLYQDAAPKSKTKIPDIREEFEDFTMNHG